MESILLKVLKHYSNISNIKDKSFLKVYANNSYQYIYNFIYEIQEITIPIVIGVPLNWDRELIDIYIKNYKKFKYIPHLDINGKVCLFDLEGVLIDKNFEGLLNQILVRFEKILYEGINELNQKDFIKEFARYWERLPRAKILKSMISQSCSTKIIKYTDNKKDVKKSKNERHIDVLKKENKYILFSSDLENDFSMYKGLNSIKNGIYVYIDSDKFIYPPDWRKELSVDYINNLLRNKSLDKKQIINNINKCNRNLLIIFNIKQPDNENCTFGVFIKSYNVKITRGEIQINHHKEIIPCAVNRCDRSFLLYRGGAFETISDKKVLIIGCGSLGGYLVNELVNIGITKLDLVDNDILKEENIYRHILGMEFINEYKAKALADYIKKNIPNININSIEDTIEDAINDGSIELSEYDLIISSVGNHNVNRWINEYVYKNEVEVPITYLWNEVLGIGHHVAFISAEYEGCYECFFGNDKDGIYDKTSYSERGQTFIRKVRGCGSSFLPFSSTNSVTTVISGIDIIVKFFEDRIRHNLLVSIKGDGYYYKKLGYSTSIRYQKQINTKNMLEGNKFVKENCLICGEKNHGH